MPGWFDCRRAGKVISWLRWPAIAYLLILLALMFFEESLLFHPARFPAGDWQAASSTFEDAWIKTPDGLSIHGWFIEHPRPRAVILLAHGNGGNITSRRELAGLLAAQGASVLLFDYRGYGRSEGKPSEAGVLADARAARRWLADRAGVDEGDIVLFGESLGGGVQVDLAAADGARGLILFSTFSSLPDVAERHYPAWIPVRWLMRSRLDSAGKIGQYRGPLLQVHGDRDRIVPFDLAQRLFEAAQEPKELIVIAGGGHIVPPSPRTLAAIVQFLDRL